MYSKSTFSLLFVFYIFTNLPAFCTENIKFKHLTVDDGLSQTNVVSIFQDKEGFMWFGTYNGLNKYDGYSFESFYSSEDTNSLSGNWIRSINEDSQGDLWIGTLNYGISRFNKTKKKFYRYYADSRHTNGLYSNDINHILIDSSNTIWFCTYIGLSKYNYETDDFTTYLIKDDFGKYWRESIIYYAADNNDGNLYLTTEKNEIYIFNKSSETFTSFDYKKGISTDQENYSKKIAFDKRGNLWIGAVRHGLYKIDKDDKHVTQYSKNKNQLNNNNVRSLFVDSTNNIWIGTDGGGINILNPETERFTYYVSDPQNPNSLKVKNGIYSIYQSKQGIIWIGQYIGAISYYDPNVKNFSNYIHNPDQINSLNNNVIRSTFIDSKNRIWIGTDGGGLNLFDINTKSFSNFCTANGQNKIISNVITSIKEDDKGNLLLGTWNEGLIVFNPESKKLKQFKHDPNNPNSLSHNNVWAIDQDKNGNIWIGTIRSGLVCFDKTKHVFINYGSLTDNKIKVNYDDIRTLLVDEDNILWIGTLNHGVNMFDIDNQKMKYFLHNPNDTNSISNNEIRTIYEDEKGQIWIGTDIGGINIYNKETKSFKCYNMKDGLPSNSVQGIVQDQNHNFWFSTTHGISRFNPADQTFVNFDKYDGLSCNEFDNDAVSITSDGTIIMGGINGLTVFHPDEIKLNPNKPDIVFTNFLLFNKPVDTQQEDAPFTGNINFAKEIHLKYYHTVFSIEFAALDFTGPDKNQYAYKLEGFDNPEKEWNYIGNKRSVTYTNLDPGKYTFKVIASNNDKTWNYQPATINIYIEPPFWETIFFRVTVILSLILGIFIFVRYRIRNIENQKQKLEIEVNRRTTDLLNLNNLLLEKQDKIENQNGKLATQTEVLLKTNSLLKTRQEELKESRDKYRLLNSTKDKFFSIIAHDLRNPFNAILGFADLLKENYHDMTDDEKILIIDTLNDSSLNVYKLLDNLLLWSKSQTQSLEYKPEPLNIYKIINSNILLFQSLADRKNISFKNNLSKTIRVLGDYNMVNTIFRNLISNAIKFTENDNIIITFDQSERHVIISVKDNGIGIEEQNLHRIFEIDQNVTTKGTNGEGGSGLGLILCKEFAERNNGALFVKSKVGGGSDFQVKLPSLQI